MNTLRWKQLRRLAILPACAALGVSSAFAQAAAPVDAATLARYDANGNGQLDADELARKNADEARGAQAPTQSAGSQESVIELSPFQVDASGDIGYYAENTLAGSRLNTNVGDLAASITVVTKQQLEDTGAVDLNDVFLYEANTEGAGNYTPVSVNRGVASDRIGGYSGDDGTPFGISTANRVRGLGSVDTAQNNYPTIARLPFDSYNTNSVEISRGPNSMLFGTGSPAGIVNQSPNEAVLGKQSNQVSTRFGSFGAYRVSLNTNIPIGDKVAIFLAGLYDERGFQRKPSYDKYRRQYAALTYQPFRNTKITASFENYDNKNSRPNFNVPADYITPWLEAGRPGWNPLTQQITFQDTGVTTAPYLLSTLDPRYVAGVTPVGDGQLNGTTSPFFIPGIQVATRNSLYIDRGNPLYFLAGSATNGGVAPALPAAGNRTAAEWLLASRRLTQSRGMIAPIPPPSTGATGYQNWYDMGITNQSLYDWEEHNASGANYGTQEAKTFNIEFQQQIIPGLNFSAGWFRQEMDEWTHYGLGQANQLPRIYVDTNTHLLDGTVNPYFGSPYVFDWQADTFFRPETNNNLRAMLAYEKDFSRNDGWTRWLGKHRFLALGSEQKTWSNNLRYRLSSQGGDARFLPNTNTTPPNNFSWAGNSANIQRIYYLGQNDQGTVQWGAQGVASPGFGGPTSASLEFYDWNTRQFAETDIEYGMNLFYAGGNYGVTKRTIDTKNFAWQAYLWKNRIVPTLGWREDTVTLQTYNGRNPDGTTLTTPQLYTNGFGNPGFWNNLGDPFEVTGRTSTRGVVVRPFRGWQGIERRVNNGSIFAEFLSNLSFHYNESDNFNPPAGVQVDFFGNRLPTPSGEGKDYGIGGSLFNNKLSFKINWYESSNLNAPANAAGTAIARAQRIDTSAGLAWARHVVRIRNGQDPTGEFFDNNTVFPLTAAMEQQIKDLLWGNFPLGSFEWPSPADYNGTIAGTESNRSEGMEVQVIYNPKRNWNIKLTVGQQDARYSDAVGELQEWINFRKPQWEALVAPDLNTEITRFNGNKLFLGRFWSGYGFSPDANSNTTGALSTPSSTYTGIFESVYFPLIAQQDTKSPGLREWSASIISNYSFQSGRLKGWAVGGSVRWQDQAVGGYYGLLDPATYARPTATQANIVFPDLSRPIYLPTETSTDLWVSYTRRIFEDKVRMKLQLNVRDVFESGGLQTILYQADGTPAQYRIKDPRQFFLSATFDF